MDYSLEEQDQYYKKIKKSVIDIEDKIRKDKKLTDLERADLYTISSVVFSNIDNSIELTNGLKSKNGRIGGFFSRLSTILKSVVAIVITVVVIAVAVVVAVNCPACILAAAQLVGVSATAFTGILTAATIMTGIAVGAHVGAELAMTYMCANPDDGDICAECVSESVLLLGIPGTGFVGSFIWDCQYCESKFPGFINSNLYLCN